MYQSRVIFYHQHLLTTSSINVSSSSGLLWEQSWRSDLSSGKDKEFWWPLAQRKEQSMQRSGYKGFISGEHTVGGKTVGCYRSWGKGWGILSKQERADGSKKHLLAGINQRQSATRGESGISLWMITRAAHCRAWEKRRQGAGLKVCDGTDGNTSSTVDVWMVGWHLRLNGHESEQTQRRWRTGKPDVLQSTGLKRAGHGWATEQQTDMLTWHA